MNYIIGTGWWCDDTGVHSHTKHQKYVDTSTRKKDFFDLWYKSIRKFTNPQSIIVVDSNSPVKPNFPFQLHFFQSHLKSLMPP